MAMKPTIDDLEPSHGEPTGRLRWIDRTLKGPLNTGMGLATWSREVRILQQEWEVEMGGLVSTEIRTEWRDVPEAGRE
jgi:hypothetical protein